ncbi:hypothetical protein M011DRAFT_50157 [Sporormia fimetaria CBS 119925]|uniref:protein-ribulosamine 3-kinase n=1 Tax=Sporormia fimetaria CBS 119925 TaxID=1340428 RepID=A0A6A6VBZ1_9PLEO|nr:hypothetical protein M011DRAFT_50157 [Sporormia fimetaria CBS 119925]
MSKIPEGFTEAVLKDEDKYKGTELDANIVAVLPRGTEIRLVCTYGVTHWSILTKIDTTVNSEPQSFFLKEYRDPNAKAMVRGEYESTAALHSIAPHNVPRPWGYGAFASDSTRFFYIQSFCDMHDDLPNTEAFVTLLAKVHAQESPNGKFGFHIPTFQGNIQNNNTSCNTWEEHFTRNLRSLIDLERSIQGRDPEMDALSHSLITKVVPRLLRPLETNGNKIKPVLLHGDMWHGNVSIHAQSGEPIIYDPGCFYGHNEYEMAPWRASRYRFNKTHSDAYHRLVPVSEPVEDADDRNLLYALRNDIQVSCTWKENKETRKLAIESMRRLVAKFPNGYETAEE